MSRGTGSIPILPESVEFQIENAITMFTHHAMWKQWGLDKLREQGAAVLFHGLPGTGKTITAHDVAKRLKVPLRSIDFAQIGSSIPGENARNIKKLFTLDEEDGGKHPVILVDECDTLLFSRSLLIGDLIWMLEPINALLASIGVYQGLVILATNQQPGFLDAALNRRLIAQIEFIKPDAATRFKIWKSKLPKKLPTDLNDVGIRILADTFTVTGAEIENAIIRWASEAIRSEVPILVSARLVQILEEICNVTKS
jgi:AAA+ superfamily predicted ATPase